MSPQMPPTGRFERMVLASDDGSAYCADAQCVASDRIEQRGGTLVTANVVIANPAAEAAGPKVIHALLVCPHGAAATRVHAPLA